MKVKVTERGVTVPKRMLHGAHAAEHHDRYLYGK